MPFSINRLINEQVCVESPPSALNMTLPAFAAERRRHIAMPTPYRNARSCRLISAADVGAQLQNCRPLLLLSVDGTDRRTDRRTDARPLHRPCSAYSAGSASKAMVHCRRRPRRPATLSRHSLGARRRLGHDATNTTQQGRQPAHDDAMTSLAATISIDVPRIVHVKL